MKVLFILVPLLAVVAAQISCDCDYSSDTVICKRLSFTAFQKENVGCEHALWKIDLSENSLQEFPDDLQQFRKVNLSLNSLENLEAVVDQRVQYLDVSKNKIFEIDLGNEFLSLRHLIVANNHLGRIDEFLDGQCNIEHLDVSENRINSLDAVTRCARLSILEASGNRISQIPKKLVLLTKLQVLDLSRNNIKDVYGLPSSLEVINLRKNYILRVSDSSFSGLTTLQALDLSWNRVKLIEKQAFASLSSLQILQMRGNQIKKLSSELLKGLKSLRGIDFNFNSIESLPNDTFRNLSFLEKVFLEGNKLSIFPALEFGTKVKIIGIDMNLITKMDHSALLTMFSGNRVGRYISLVMNNFRGDDPEWSNVLKYFAGECSREVRHFLENGRPRDLPHFDKFTLAASPCACAVFRKDYWSFAACIADGAEVDGLPWLEAAEIYAGNTDKDGGRHSKLKRDEF